MRVIHRVPDKFTSSRHVHKFTTKNRSRWISFDFVHDTFTSSRLVRDSLTTVVRDLFTTDFYSRHIRDRFTTRSNSSVAGDLANLRSECRHVILRHPTSSCDSTSQTEIFSWCRSKADFVGDVFISWIIFNVTSLPHDSFVTRSRQLSFTNES
jgi:hypothetical protein